MTKVVLALAAFLMAGSLYAQSPGTLLFPGETDPMMLQWGQDVVEAYLALHKMPASEATNIMLYGRQDLRDNIRAFGWIALQAIMADPNRSLTAQEQNVLNRYVDRARQLRVGVLDVAVAERNRFLADMCTWKPDPDLARVSNYSWDGNYHCPRSVYALDLGAIPPVYPTKDYFLALGQRKTWVDPISGRPGGLRSFATITLGGQLILGIGIPFALAGGVAVVLLITKIATIANKIFIHSDFARAAGWVGVGITVALTLICIVFVVYLYTENERILTELNTLDYDRAFVAAQPSPDRATLALMSRNDKAQGLLYTTYLYLCVPYTNVNSTRALPTPVPGPDPVFVVQQGASAPVENLSITYAGWDGERYRAKMWGGWFVQEGLTSIPNLDATSINTRMRYQWAGKKYELDRMGQYFGVQKKDPAATDIECPPDRTTGLSSAADFSRCRSFVATSVQMDLDGIGTRTVSITQPIRFTSPLTDGVTVGTTEGIALTATGLPAPVVSITSTLPAGFTFEPGASAGSATLRYSGAAITAGEYLFSLRAANSNSSGTAQLKVTVADLVRKVAPEGNSVSVPAGDYARILVKVSGTPVPTLTQSGGLESCGLAYRSVTANSGYLEGRVSPPSLGCAFNFSASNGTGFYSFVLSVQVTAPVSQPVLVDSSFDVPLALPRDFWIRTTGASGPVTISLTRDAGGQQLAPSWVSLRDDGDGTATLMVNPPPDAPARVLVPLWYRVTGTGGNLAVNTTDGVYLNVIKEPILLTTGPMMLFRTGIPDLQYNGGNAISADGHPVISSSATLPPGLSIRVGDFGNWRVEGRPQVPADVTTSIVASNAFGSSSTPVRIVVSQAAKITSPRKVNFYMGRNNTFTVTATGFPMQPLSNAPTGAPAAMTISTDGANASGILPAGLQFRTTDPVTGDQLYGRALITGQPTVTGYFYFRMFAQTAGLEVDSQDFAMVVTSQGDVNGDMQVNCADASFITSRFGQRRGMSNYDYNADYNQDGVIDVRDLSLVTARLPAGMRCQ